MCIRDSLGPVGAAKLVVGRYWLGPAALMVILIYVVVALSGQNDPTPAVVFLVTLSVLFAMVGLLRAVGAARAGRAFREER